MKGRTETQEPILLMIQRKGRTETQNPYTLLYQNESNKSLKGRTETQDHICE